MKKLLILMFAVLLIAVIFVSCDGEEPSVPDGSAENADKSNISVTICAGKETSYQIIYPDGAPEELKLMARSVAEKIDALGGSIRMTNDWTKNVEATAANYEILIGNTNRPETLEVMNSIGYDDYAIRAVGNKIVVTAHAADRLAEAVEYFCANSMVSGEVEGKAVIGYTEDYEYSGKRSYLINHESPLSGFRIVSRSDSASMATAKRLAEAINKKYGVNLKVVADSTSPAKNEIVLGATNRDISKKYIDSSAPYQSVIKAENGSLLIGSSSVAATDYAVTSFINDWIHDYYDNTFNCLSTYKHEGSVGNFKNSAELAEGADIRVFSMNVLFDWEAKNPTVGERSIALGAILEHFNPDVLGLQEASESWHKVFETMLKNGTYKIVDKKTTGGKLNYCTILYNTKKVELLDHGAKTYAERSDPSIRVISWACFKTKSTGEKFIVVNTHWDIQDFSQFVMPQAVEMAVFCNDLQKKYNCPVITTGDYNRNEDTDEYKKFMQLTKFQEAKHTAKAVDLGISGYHKQLGAMPNLTALKSVDHIFGSKDIEFMFYTALVDQIVLDASDHCPIFADIKLN